MDRVRTKAKIPVEIRSRLGGRSAEQAAALLLEVSDLGELLGALESRFRVTLKPRPTSCFVVCDTEGNPIVRDQHMGIGLVDVIDVHVLRSGEHICAGQDRAFEFLPGDTVDVSEPRGC
jgi:hypothetical protein